MWLAIGVFLFVGIFLPSPGTAQVLDRMEIVPSTDTEDIQIVFNTRVVYLSHSPEREGDLLQIFLSFPEFPPSQRLGRQQQASPPRSALIPKFSVIFPDQETNRTKSLTIKFSKPVKYTVSLQRKQQSSILIISVLHEAEPSEAPEIAPPAARPPPRAKAPPPTIPPFPPGGDLQTYADTLMKQGEAALEAGEYQSATAIFNALLNLPPNAHSQRAQELVGLARERSGEIAKAKLEYKLYLKLYPKGEGATRVRQRLAALSAPSTPAPPKLRKAKKRPPRQIKEFSVYGTLTQFYFGGFSQRKTTDANGTTKDSTEDQSVLLTTADYTGRYRYNQYDNKLVFRGSYAQDFLDTRDQKDPRLRAIYLEHAEKERYMIRLGRQPGNAGGILDLRFDGGWFSYVLSPEYQLNLVAGQTRPFRLTPGRSADDPRELRIFDKRWLTGINLDIGPLWEAWSGNVYFLNQMVHNLVDRRAVGGEIRYFEPGRTAFLLLDYDIFHHALNIVNFNGTWVNQKGTTFNLLIDHRKSPFAQTTNALLANGTNAVEAALHSLSTAELRLLVDALSGDSTLYLVGVTHPFTPSWQIGGDIRLNRTSGNSSLVQDPNDTSPFPNLSTSLLQLPGSGNIWTFTLQALGSNFLWENHTLVVNTSYIHTPDSTGESFGLSSLARFGNKWQLDSVFNFFHQNTGGNTNQYRFTPSVRVDYRLYDDIALEGLFGLGQTFSYAPTQDDSTLREFFFFGIRWER